MTVFDGPTADTTCPRRIRSNTPLQALTTLNNAVFVEAAQAMARRVVQQGPKTVPERVRFAFRLCLSRGPNARETQQLSAFYNSQLARFRSGALDAAAVALSDPTPKTQNLDVPELAAWTSVARVLLNLDETITKE